MIARLLASTILRKLAPVLAGLAIVGLIAWGISGIYERGFEAGKAEAVVAIAAARLQAEIARTEALRERNAALEKLTTTERAMRALEQDAARRIAEAQQHGSVQVQTVERVIRENPDFASIRRPADLQRVRDEQLAAIAAAAARTPTTAELSGASLRALPGARP